MDSELRDKLRGEVMASWWEDLAPHHARGAVLLLEPGLDLLDAAVAMASDQVALIEGWLSSGRMRRTSDSDKQAFEARSEGVRFQFVVVQPWVLAQALR